MKAFAFVLAAGMSAIGAGDASAHSYSFSLSYGPGYYGRPGYFYPRYHAYPRYYSYGPYYGPPRYYTYYAPPRVVYAYPPPPPRVVYVERYVETPPPPPRPTPRVERKPQASIAPPAARFERQTLSATELFEFDRAVLRLPQPRLDEIADALNRNPQIANVRITGHTDRLGTDAYNRRLSERRAEAVKSYLVSKGVAAHRLNAAGKGESSPVVHCRDQNQAELIRCLEPNRRVEIEAFTVERRIAEPARKTG